MSTRRPSLGPWLRGLFYEITLVGSVVVWGLISLPAGLLPYRQRFWFISRWAIWMLPWLRICCGVRWQVEGLENIPERTGVVMSKHQSTWETLALARWFSPQSWVLKRELSWLPVFGWALALLRPIAIDRAAGRDAVNQVVAQGRQRLANGQWVVVFPEGTRVRAGQRLRYRIGGAVLAVKAGVPVVPVAHNAGHYWPRRSIAKYPGTVRVRIGPAIPTEGATPEQVIARVEEWIEDQMVELDALAVQERGNAS